MSDDFDITLDGKADDRGGGVMDVRRIERTTGAGRRRRRSSEDRARIVEESFASGVSVSEVARRHGLSPQQLFGWRHAARASVHGAGGGQSPAPGIGDDAPAFAPVVVTKSARSPPRRSSRPPAVVSSAIEIEMADAVVRIIGQAETEAIVAVLRAVRRTS